MPANKKYVTHGYREPPVDPEVWQFLHTGQWSNEGYGRFKYSDAELAALWAEHGPQITADWVQENPGTRPALWWQFDAPERERKRLGGHGEPQGRERERTSWCGVPTEWLGRWLVDYYRREHGSDHQQFDKQCPPYFESEAAFLARQNLLTPRERARLKPEAYEPETLPQEFWPDND